MPNVERRYIKRTMKDVPEEYKKRWRIKNNFKSVEQMRTILIKDPDTF